MTLENAQKEEEQLEPASNELAGSESVAEDITASQAADNNKRAFRTGMIIVCAVLLIIACVIFFLFDPRDWIAGQNNSWSLGNFALMDLVVFESVFLLVGGFVTVTRKERRAEEEAAVDVRWIPRLLSVIVMVVALVLFIMVENVDFLPLVYFDDWTWAFVVLVIIQTVLVALSKKRYGAKEGALVPVKQAELEESEDRPQSAGPIS